MYFNGCSDMMQLIEPTGEKQYKKNVLGAGFLIRACSAEKSFEFMLYKRSTGVTITTITQRRLF